MTWAAHRKGTAHCARPLQAIPMARRSATRPRMGAAVLAATVCAVCANHIQVSGIPPECPGGLLSNCDNGGGCGMCFMGITPEQCRNLSVGTGYTEPVSYTHLTLPTIPLV